MPIEEAGKKRKTKSIPNREISLPRIKRESDIKVHPVHAYFLIRSTFIAGTPEQELKIARKRMSDGERRAVLEDVIKMKKQGFPILNSAGRLSAMIGNDWRCHDDILINVDPDGTVTRGCYVKSRGRINCRACGFSAVSEASGALDLLPGSLRAGWSIFLK